MQKASDRKFRVYLSDVAYRMPHVMIIFWAPYATQVSLTEYLDRITLQADGETMVRTSRLFCVGVRLTVEIADPLDDVLTKPDCCASHISGQHSDHSPSFVGTICWLSFSRTLVQRHH